MKISIGNIVGHAALAVLCFSSVVDGIRSSISLLSASMQSGDRRIGRTFVLNTRGGSNCDFNNNGESSVSVVPDATLPNSLSGMTTTINARMSWRLQ